jgi:hypothetical protein
MIYFHFFLKRTALAALQLLFRNGFRLLLVALTAGLVFAQGPSGSSHHSGFDLKMPPPLALPQAYTLATMRLGPATNSFFCISATCAEPANFTSRGWTFGFSNTNRQIVQVKVFFDKDVYIDPQDSELLK